MNEFCSNCGAILQDNTRFCAKCGTPVGLPGSPAPSPLPSPTTSKRTGKQRRTKWLLLPALAVMVVFAFFVSPAFGFFQRISRAKAAEQAFERGATYEQSLSSGKASLGHVGETGWGMDLERDTFSSDSNLTMQVLSFDQSKRYIPSTGKLVGGLVDIKIVSGGQDLVYPHKPATLSMQIPSSEKFAKKNMDLYVAACLYSGEWFTVHPLASDLAKGVVTFESDHFTSFATLRLDEKELLEKLATDHAKREWSKGNSKEQVMTRLQTTIRDALSEAGMPDKKAQDDILLGIQSSPKYDTLVTDIENGKKVDLNKVCSEMTSDAIMARYVDFPGSSMLMPVTVVSSLAKGSAELHRGNYKEAAVHFTKAMAKAFPPTQMINSAIENVQLTGILARDWDRFSERVAFIVYKEHIGDKGASYSTTSPEWIRVMTELYGSPESAEQAALADYANRTGERLSNLEKDPAKRKAAIADFNKAMKERFSERYVLERDLAKRQTEYVKIVQGMADAGLLTRGTLVFGDDVDIRDRIDELFAQRAYILHLFGGKMPIRATGESQEDNLNQALAYLLTCRGDTAEFIRWLVEQGYKPAETRPSGTTPVTTVPVQTTGTTSAKTTAPTQPKETAVLDPDSDVVPVVSTGSFICRTWINTRMDSFSVDGGTLTQASWSYRRGYVGYVLTGTCRPGETVSLGIAGTMGAMGYQMEHQGNDLVMSVKAFDSTGKEISNVTGKVDMQKSKSSSLSDALVITVPANAAKVTLSGSFECNWVTPNAVASETVAVSVTLSVKK